MSRWAIWAILPEGRHCNPTAAGRLEELQEEVWADAESTIVNYMNKCGQK